MEGEKLQYFTEEGAKKAKWTPAEGAGELLTWYKVILQLHPNCWKLEYD